MRKINRTALIFASVVTTLLALSAQPLKVSAARLDTHTGMIACNALLINAYNDAGCGDRAMHYLCPGDWYETLSSNSTSAHVKYPITVPATNTVTGIPIYFQYYFKYSEFHRYSDSSTGSFSLPFNSAKWYNHLPGQITYTDRTDDGSTDNGSMTYVSNNNKIYPTSADLLGHKILYCDDGNSVMYADYIPLEGRIFYDYFDKKDADWHWYRASQQWSTDNLKQGRNTVYFAGTDASANYKLGQAVFHYDTVKPIIYYGYDISTGTVTVSADDDKSGGAGTCSGLDYYQYRLSSDGGKTWTGWSRQSYDQRDFSIAESGIYTLQVRAFDNAGNETQKEYDGIIKRSPPSANIISDTYHTGTDVFTSINIKNTSSVDILPTDNFSVKFDISGITSQSKTFVIPGNQSALVWFKWHTPVLPCDLSGTFTIHTDGGDIPVTAKLTVTKLTEKTPPDPQGRDTMPSGFSVVSAGGASTPLRSWTEWSYENSAFKQNTYSASLSSAFTAVPDSHCPTAFCSPDGIYTMKSGYGINETVNTTVTTNSPADVTPCQNVLGMYPEFQYNFYWRLFESFAAGKFQLAQNGFSMYNSRTHFTPVWWKNDVNYVPEVYCFDAWTPAGMMTCYATDTLHINGSCFDDWHVHPAG